MIINTNLAAQSAAAQLVQSSASLAQSLARLSSGSRITSPADDTAGLAVSMKLTAQVARLNAAGDDVSHALSFCQTQDGYLQQVSNALNRMSELTVQAQDVTKTTSDRLLYNQELLSLESYVHGVANKEFNGVSLFSGATLNVATDGSGNSFAMAGVNLGNSIFINLYGDRVNPVGDGSTGAVYAMNDVKKVITQLATDRAQIGANEEVLEQYSGQVATLKNNLSAAGSQITDVDVARESTNYAKANILVQTGTAMLAQANSLPQSVLKLLS
ncbi:MAG TPA: flagellin [Candidatus Sulfotelmatobacter sp.]|nr:flagellin [Candidatus Sulfotelmatobacter sp.]